MAAELLQIHPFILQTNKPNEKFKKVTTFSIKFYKYFPFYYRIIVQLQNSDIFMQSKLMINIVQKNNKIFKQNNFMSSDETVKIMIDYRKQEHILRLQFLLMDKENIKFCPDTSKSINEGKSCSSQMHFSRQDPKKLSKNDGYQIYMKYLIASNSDYFQNKLTPKQVGRPKDIKFKIPSHTGMTIYKRDYKKMNNKYQVEQGIKRNMSIDCIKTNNFIKDDPNDIKLGDKTMYQKEFRYHNIRTQHRKPIKRVNTHQNQNDKEVPRFLQTQNKSDFLNWGGKNYVPSMKPEQKPAITYAPFDARSVYKSDFQGKMTAPIPLCVRDSSFPKFGCSSQIMKSSYNDQYSLKKGDTTEIDCKPRHYDATLCKLFKGTTQYKRQFKKQKKGEEQYSSPPRTVQQLQTIIIDL